VLFASAHKEMFVASFLSRLRRYRGLCCVK